VFVVQNNLIKNRITTKSKLRYLIAFNNDIMQAAWVWLAVKMSPVAVGKIVTIKIRKIIILSVIIYDKLSEDNRADKKTAAAYAVVARWEYEFFEKDRDGLVCVAVFQGQTSDCDA